MPGTFDVSSRRIEHDGTLIVVDMTGDLDTYAACTLDEELTALIEDDVVLVLNFASVRMINSTAMGTIFHAAESVQKHGGSMCFFGLNPQVKRVLDLVGLTRLAEIFETEQEALSKAKKS